MPVLTTFLVTCPRCGRKGKPIFLTHVDKFGVEVKYQTIYHGSKDKCYVGRRDEEYDIKVKISAWDKRRLRSQLEAHENIIKRLNNLYGNRSDIALIVTDLVRVQNNFREILLESRGMEVEE